MALTKRSANQKDVRAGIGPMEHRHFATVATVIRELDLSGYMDALPTEQLRDDIARQFAKRLRSSNPRFDKERFLLACDAR